MGVLAEAVGVNVRAEAADKAVNRSVLTSSRGLVFSYALVNSVNYLAIVFFFNKTISSSV